MKLVDNIIYIEFKEAISIGISEGTLKAALSRKSASWSFINDPSDKRKVLIQYDKLKDKYKKMVVAKYGEPAVYLADQIIKQQLTNHPYDVTALSNYRDNNGAALPNDALKKYIEAASWLRFIAGCSVSKIRQLGYAKAPDFYNAVINLITNDDVKLPRTYPKLMKKAKRFTDQGVLCLIHASRGKASNNKKVIDDVCESLLLELIAHSNQFEDPFVALKYNEMLSEKGYKPISAATVGRYRRERNMLIAASRNGSAAWRDMYDKVVHRVRPSAPLMLINSDDLDLDLYFKEERINSKGHKQINYYYRFKLMVVIDAYNNYPLGIAIGETQTEELVKAAYADAINHVHELTGSHYLWQQIVTDHWGLSALQDWYKEQAIFTPAKVGNARSKPIEAFFAQWHPLLKQYNNYSGHNITAHNKPNFEAIQRQKKQFPDKIEGLAQVREIITRLRTQADVKTGKSLQQEWLEGYEINQTRMTALDDIRRLQLFGVRHPWRNELTNAGINITINGKTLTYDVPEADYMRNVGKKMQVYYSPYNLNSILAEADGGRTKILCHLYEPMKMAIADMKPGDRHLINVRLEEKKRISQHVLNAQEERRSTLDRNGINAQSVIQAGYFNKEIHQLAERNYRAQQLNEPDAFDGEIENPEPNQQDSDVWDL